MLNCILFQAVINIDRVFWSEPQKKLKNKENFIRGKDFSFFEMKIFRIKNSSSE